MSTRIIAACDGASKGNPGPAGWAWVIAGPTGEPERWAAGPLGRATNNVGELTALERLLAAVAPGTAMEVRMDSQYAMKAVTQWLPGWKRNGWRTSGNKPVANRELVETIDALLGQRDVSFVYVPAHQVGGDPLNAIADQAASDAATGQSAAGSERGDALPVPSPTRAAPARGAASGGGRAGSGRSAPRKAGGARTLKAKYPGRCAPCGRPYAAGATISKLDEGWGHEECRTGA
ncbi:ribonuclease H [Streptomyces sp. NPDC060194]|uniref:ribonuclease H family protein n=1 Tax=Streptomyces sp. NPDC060194 TaxID=3347069 RepID=UPI00364A7CFF